MYSICDHYRSTKTKTRVARCGSDGQKEWRQKERELVMETCAGILEQSIGTRNRVVVLPASLCILAGCYDNLIPTLFLAPIDCLKIPALSPNF
jgi:hypothetical protein